MVSAWILIRILFYAPFCLRLRPDLKPGPEPDFCISKYVLAVTVILAM